MSKELRLVLPLPPSVNAMYFSTKYGKRVRTKKAIAWFDEAESIIKKSMDEQGWSMVSGEKVIVDINVHWPDARIRDTNNLSKPTPDALEHAGVFDNDRWALLRFIDFDIDRENPRVDIVIRRFDKERDGWKH